MEGYDWYEKEERIKELEDDLTTFVDEVNRLTVIKKELEQELERYKAFVKQFYSNGEFEYNDIVYEALKEFEEAKE